MMMVARAAIVTRRGEDDDADEGRDPGGHVLHGGRTIAPGDRPGAERKKIFPGAVRSAGPPRSRGMRHLPLFGSLALLLLASGTARAESDEAFGTTPARDMAAPVAVPAGAAPRAHTADVMVADSAGGESQERAPIAVDPPKDWAVLHGGVRPHLGTFAGIATLAVAHARTERFYGLVSLSLVRSDVGTHAGLAQFALGRSLSDTFAGGLQLSVSENRARHFYGVGQVALAYNRTKEMTALTRVAAFNRADERFTGVTEVGAFNYDRHFWGLVQVGAFNVAADEIGFTTPYGERAGSFNGLVQLGGANLADDFNGVLQLGAANYATSTFTGLAQVGVFATGARRFRGLLQIGGGVVTEDSVGIQIGAGNVALEKHVGLELGGVNVARDVTGAQIGIGNVARRVDGVQIGVFNHAKHLRGVQIGLANHAEDGVLPWTAILNMGFGDAPGYDDDVARAAAPSAL